jgi:hypothetical protein
MYTKQFFLIGFLTAILLSACSNSASIPATALPFTAPALIIPTASATTGVVAGRLLSNETGKPFANRYVFLAGVSYNNEGQGAFFVDTTHSPTTQTDENGFFLFVNVLPQKYVLVVGEPAMGSVAITDKASGDPKIWDIKPGKITQMDEIRFELPK